MDFLLMDIRKFLRKLENGQMEIEAGQWELHKDIESMNAAVTELMTLKEDVENIAITSEEHMAMIKELQMRLDAIDKSNSDFDNCTAGESVCKRKTTNKTNAEYSKTITDTKELDDNSEVSFTESKTDCQQTVTSSEEGRHKSRINTKNNTFHPSVKKEANVIVPPKSQRNSHHTKRTANNEILERYLKDSAKYISRKISRHSKNCYKASKPTARLKTEESESECTSFWDQHNSRGRPEQKTPKCVSMTKKAIENVIPVKVLHCPKCPKQFKYKDDFLRHEKKHRKFSVVFRCVCCGKRFTNKDRLKEHEAIHRKVSVSKSFNGFRCSYCDKICSTPEKLTAHLRQCRIIKKTYISDC